MLTRYGSVALPDATLRLHKRALAPVRPRSYLRSTLSLLLLLKLNPLRLLLPSDW